MALLSLRMACSSASIVAPERSAPKDMADSHSTVAPVLALILFRASPKSMKRLVTYVTPARPIPAKAIIFEPYAITPRPKVDRPVPKNLSRLPTADMAVPMEWMPSVSAEPMLPLPSACTDALSSAITFFAESAPLRRSLRSALMEIYACPALTPFAIVYPHHLLVNPSLAIASNTSSAEPASSLRNGLRSAGL